MKTANASLITLLGTVNEIVMADLLTITLLGGGVLYLTSADIDITYGGNTYLSRGIQFARSKIKTVVGIQVDSLSLSLYGDSTTLINGQALFTAAVLGVFDGASVRLERAYMQTIGTIVGTLIQFIGNISQADIGRTEVKLQVKSNLELLNIMMPRNVWQQGCINTLYDTACGLPRTPVASSTNAGSTSSIINCGLTNADGYFNLGYITYTSGANNGVRRTIKTYTVGILTTMNPLPNVPALNDTFNAFRGCDKTQSTCNGYGNLARYRGMPYIPSPDVLT